LPGHFYFLQTIELKGLRLGGGLNSILAIDSIGII